METTQTSRRPRGLWQRHRGLILGGAALGLAAILAAVFLGEKKPPARKSTTISISLPPLPPPPPPPPTPPPEPPPPQEKQPEFEPEEQPEEKPPEEPPQPDEPPIGTDLQGEGPADGFGLAAGGGLGGKGLGGKGSNRSKWGWYAGQVQSRVGSALRSHKLTKSATLSLQVRIWADSSGRVTRATLAGSSGNAATDAALRDDILTGLQLSSPPPEGMPMPIVLRISAKRPR